MLKCINAKYLEYREGDNDWILCKLNGGFCPFGHLDWWENCVLFEEVENGEGTKVQD